MKLIATNSRTRVVRQPLGLCVMLVAWFENSGHSPTVVLILLFLPQEREILSCGRGPSISPNKRAIILTLFTVALARFCV